MRNNYYELKKIVDEGYTECQSTLREYNKLKKEREEGHYSYEYLQSEILPKMDKLKQKISSIQDKVRSESKRITEAEKAGLKRADRLNPSELTDDVKLLQGNLILEEADIEGILERSTNNRTMTQLALRYAKEHEMKINGYYNKASYSSDRLDEINDAVSIIVKWFDTDSEKSYKNIYDVIFGDDSGTSEAFSISE